MNLIAEIGTTHAGSLDHARRLLDEVATAGFDCAKFQWVIASELLHPKVGDVELPGGRVDLFNRFRELERDKQFYAEIKRECESRGLLFLCTVFGPKSLNDLLDLTPEAIKIASPELNYVQLLRAAATSGTPLYVSTGVSTLEDIARANEALGAQVDVTFLHCVTAYPAPESEYNLACIEPLSRLTGRDWGVSDHTLDPLAVPLTAAALGAHSLEKHVTLNREGEGLDDPIALPPNEFRTMVTAVRELAGAFEDSPENAERIAAVSRRLGKDKVTAIIGDGVKRLAPSERDSYGLTNRSLHAVRDMSAGERLKLEDIAIVRTERNLRPGLDPRHLDVVQDAPLCLAVSAGDGITWEAVICRENEESVGLRTRLA
ncbi:MAG: N-acetylneuraminate synthase family protein [Spirochaetia bacterium]